MHSGRLKRDRDHIRSQSRQQHHHQPELTTVGEYALHHLFNNFIKEADDRINRCVAEPNEYEFRIETVCGPSADAGFDQLISALGHIVRHKPKSLIDSLMLWRKGKSDATTQLYSELQAARSTGGQQYGTMRRLDSAHSVVNGTTNQYPTAASAATISDIEYSIRQAERRSAISVYILCRVLIEVIKQCDLAALTNDTAERLEDTIWIQLCKTEPEAVYHHAIKRAQWDIFGRLLGEMSRVRFDRVVDKYITDLETAHKKLGVKGHAEKELETKTALLVHQMRFLQVKSYPEEAWDSACDLFQLLASLFAGVHGQQIKYAYCQLFEDLLLPIAGTATSEFNLPKWKQVLETIRPKLSQLLMKPKHWMQAFPLMTVVACVSPIDAFSQQWLATALQIQPKLKERATRPTALKALCRLVWRYVYRTSETQNNTIKKLEEITRMVFHTGKRSILSTEPSIADPLIQLIRIIGFKHQDFCFRTIIFPLMNSELFMSGRDLKIDSLDPEKMVIAIRAFLAVMADLERGKRPSFPAVFESEQLQDPFSGSASPHRRSVSQSSVTISGRVERLSRPVITSSFGEVAKEAYVKFCKILGEITMICDNTFGGQAVLDEKFAAQTTPKTPMADAFSFGRRDELMNPTDARQSFYDLLHVAVQALPRCLSPHLPFNSLVNLLCTGTAHVQSHIASSSAQSLKSIARQSSAQQVTIGFARFIFNFDDRYATVADGGLLGPGHIESTLRLYVELLEIWIEDLHKGGLNESNLRDGEQPAMRNGNADLSKSRVLAHVDEIESHGLFFLCSPSRHVRAFAIRVLRLVTRFDTALGETSTRIISILEGSSQDVIDVDDEKLTLAERSRLQKGLRKSNLNNTLVELCGSDIPHDSTLWFKVFPNLIRLSMSVCPQAVLLTRDIVCARLSHTHKAINALAEGPRQNPYTAFESAFVPRHVGRLMIAPPEITIEQWKLHLIFACTTLTNIGSQTPIVSQSSQHTRKSSKTSSITQGADKITSAAELFNRVVPFLSANHSAVRDAAALGLGSINANLYRPLLESLQSAVASCNEDAKTRLAMHQRNVSSPRRNRRSDYLRTEITHLYKLTAHCLHDPEISGDEWILQNLVNYTKELRIFLNDEDVQNQWDFQKLRTYYCGLMETFYEGIRKAKDPSRWMPFQSRKAAFAMMEDWCGYSPNQEQLRHKENSMRRSVLDMAHETNTRAVTAAMEIEKRELKTAALSAMAALCAGPIYVLEGSRVTQQFDMRRMQLWIDTIFDQPSDRTHATGRRALKNLITHNREHNFLLSGAIEKCYTARSPKALSSYFDVVSQVLTENSDDATPFWKILCAGLYTLGNERSDIRLKSVRLLRTLEERHHKSSKLQDLDISVSDKTTAVYKLAQFEISRRLAHLHSELAFHVFSEFSVYFGMLQPDHQRNMVAAMLPWIQTINLQLDPNGGPTASSYMLLVNLFEITVRSSTALHNEIQALWQALATGPHGGNVQLVLDFIIAVCLDRREQNFVDYAKQVVVFLSSTAAGQKVVDFLMLQITPRSMVAEKHERPPVPQDASGLPYIADLSNVLPLGNKQSVLSLGQLSLMLLVDLIVSPIQLPKEKIPVLLQVVIVLWDYYAPMVQDQAREMLVHLIHELVISRIEPGSTSPDKQSIEDLIESIRRHDTKVVWAYEDQEAKEGTADRIGVPEPMSYVIEEVVKVFAVSYPGIHEDWARTTLTWATSCAVRHIACRSFQIFRCIIGTIDQAMLADMLARLSNTIADDENDYLTFSLEILTTLRTVIHSLEPAELIRYPQLFWVTCACLDTIFEREFQESLSMLEELINKLDLSDPALVKLFLNARPSRWEGDFEGLHALVHKGLRSSTCLERSLGILERMIKLPSSELVGDSHCLLFTVLGNLPRYLQVFEDDTDSQACYSSADVLATAAEQQGCDNLARALTGFASQRYRNVDDFLGQTVSAIRTAFFPSLEYQSLVFLIGLLNNQLPWFKINTMKLLCVIIPDIDMRKPEIASQGPDLISPVLRLLQTTYCPQALLVLDKVMSMTGTPLDNKHLRMSMAGAHSSRATRKEYDSTQSLYGIPEESGWSIPMPAVHSARTRHNVHAVFYTCGSAGMNGTEDLGTPDIPFQEEYQYGSYFSDRTATMLSEDTRADTSMGELVMKLDSLDDFFDDQVDAVISPAGRNSLPRYPSGLIEDHEHFYDKQTLPILHKSLNRNASVTSFQTGFADMKYTSSRDPAIMTPTAFAAQKTPPTARPGLHGRSSTSPAMGIGLGMNSAFKRTPPQQHLHGSDFLSGDEAENEPISDDESSFSRLQSSEEALPQQAGGLAGRHAAGLRAGFRSGMRRLTGGAAAAERKEARDAVRGVFAAGGPKSPRVPRVPAVWLRDPKSADL